MAKKFSSTTDMFSPEHGYLGFLLRQAAHTYHLKMEKALSDYGLTPPQFTILKIVSVYSGCSNAEIARYASLTPQTVNLMINKLEKLEFVIKSAHPHNKKVQCIEITKDGLHILEQSSDAIEQLEVQLEHHFSSEEIYTLRKWFAFIQK
jgi:DNA-binding MarR family transcriptional regulator